jgi:hypothetical protein
VRGLEQNFRIRAPIYRVFAALVPDRRGSCEPEGGVFNAPLDRCCISALYRLRKNAAACHSEELKATKNPRICLIFKCRDSSLRSE